MMVGYVYGGDKPVPIQGTCQGNGKDVPTDWALVSTQMFQVMKKAGHGVSQVK